MATYIYHAATSVLPDSYSYPMNLADLLPEIKFDLASLEIQYSLIELKSFNGFTLHVEGMGFEAANDALPTGGKVDSFSISHLGEDVIEIGHLENVDAEVFMSVLLGFISPWNLLDWLLAGDDVVHGGAGDDNLYGLSGDDVIYGNDGDDFIEPGAGNDTVHGDNGEIDFLSYQDARAEDGATHGITLDVASGTVTDAWGGLDHFDGFEVYRGTLFKDSFTGSDANEWFQGIGGRDTIDGGGGTDMVEYYADDWNGGHQGVKVDLAAGYAIDGFGFRDTLLNIENVDGTKFADTLNGDGGANVMYGEDGNDTVSGGAGEDNLHGDGGDDKLYGEDDNDFLWGFDGNDRLDGGLGDDLMGGGKGNDSYYVDSASDVVNESIDKGSGIDTVYASISFNLNKSATVLGDVENLTLTGTQAISATGNALSNIITGNSADNTLTGGKGADFFVFNTTLRNNVDRITDFDPAQDTIRLDHAIFTAHKKVGAISASTFVTNKTGLAADKDDHVIYQSNTGKLFYDIDGKGGHAAIQFALLSANLKLTSADFVII